MKKYLLTIFCLFILSPLISQDNAVHDSLQCSAHGPNVVANPGFELGDTLFTNEYIYSPPWKPIWFSKYSITNHYELKGLNSVWNALDHENLDSSRKFLIVDPDDGTKKVWEQTVQVCEGNEYAFSAWVKDALPTGDGRVNPTVSVLIDGDTVIKNFAVPDIVPQDDRYWTQLYHKIDIGSKTEVTITILLMIGGASGNDLLLDDVYFGLCGKELALTESNSPLEIFDGDSLLLELSPSTTSSGWVNYEWFQDSVLIASGSNQTSIYANDTSSYYILAYLPGGCAVSSDLYKVNSANPYLYPKQDSIFTTEDTPANVNLLTNDLIKVYNGYPTISITNLPKNGEITSIDTLGNLLYTPFSNFAGVDSFYYSLYDIEIGISDTVLVYITITEEPDAPIAHTDQASVQVEAQVEILFLNNDIDIDGDIDTNSAKIIAGPTFQEASVTLNNDKITYQSGSLTLGTDSIQYVICDLQNQCDTGTIFIEIKPLDLNVFNGISPNGDGVNDFWFIDGIDIYSENKVEIYNRWGNLIFDIQNYDNDSNFWYGQTNSGRKLPDGTYFYLIQIEDTTLNGFIILSNP